MVISVLVSTRNYAVYLERTIDSLLNQTRPPDEIIVSDNGSSDGSQELLKKYGSKIKFLENQHCGQMGGLNAAYAESTGDILCFLDGDDTFYPEKLEVIEGLFRHSYRTDERILLSHWMDLIDQNDKKSGLKKPNHLLDYWGKRTRAEKNCHQLSDPDMTRNVFKAYGYPHLVTAPTSSLVITRPLAHILFPVPEEPGIVSGADNYLVRGACLFAPCYFYDAPLGGYREHGSNLFYRHGMRGEPDRTGLHLSVQNYLRRLSEERGEKLDCDYFHSGYALTHHKKNNAVSSLLGTAWRRLRARPDARNGRLVLAIIKAILLKFTGGNS